MRCPNCSEVIPFKEFQIIEINTSVARESKSKETSILLQTVCPSCMTHSYQIIDDTRT